MEIFIGSDHRGFEWKEKLKTFFATTPEWAEYEICDMGPFSYDADDDFNDAAVAVAQNVRENRGTLGVLLCGSGDGVAIQANRFKRIRAARCKTVEEVKLAREHDDINVLCLAADGLTDDLAKNLTKTFITTKFDVHNENRNRRINRLDEREDYA